MILSTYCSAADEVLAVIQPYLDSGVLTAQHLAYDENKRRGNLIIGYTPTGWTEDNGTISFIGSHLDVVPGKPEEWEDGRNPFELKIEVSKRQLLFISYTIMYYRVIVIMVAVQLIVWDMLQC